MESSQPQKPEGQPAAASPAGAAATRPLSLPQVDQARAALRDLDTRVSTFIRERPGTALLGALAIGYVVGRLASRR